MYISIVVPVYKEEENIKYFLDKIKPVLTTITDDFEVIFALDPSPDLTENRIIEQRNLDERVKLVKFSRRVGQPMATLGGLRYANGDAVIVMDVDLQDPVELLPDMISLWRQGNEVVIPQRISRAGEPLIKVFIASFGYYIIRKISDVDIPINTGDFRLMSRKVVTEVLKLKESHGFLRGMVAVVGFKQCLLKFSRPARVVGESNYNRFIGSLKIGFNGVFGFSSYALTLSTQMGFLTAITGFIFAAVYLVMKLTGFSFPIGNPTLVILILFIGGVQLISIGILGEYVGRIYDEVRRRPKYIVEKSVGCNEVDF